jgi:hypothetical protein
MVLSWVVSLNLRSRSNRGSTYRCRGRGALLSLPHGGCREDAITTGAFHKYIQNNVISWFSWAQKNGLGVQHMEDLILVSGCTLAISWAAAAFVDHTIEAEISLESIMSNDGGAYFVWRRVQGPVVHHNSRFDPVRNPAYLYSICTNFSFFLLLSEKRNPPATPDQCVFIRGFRAKRVLFWTKPIQAAAEPRPDDPDDRRNDGAQMIQVPGVPKVGSPPM